MYVEKTDKEIIEQLKFCDNYEAAYLIKSLKKQVAKLKREITKVEDKSDYSGSTSVEARSPSHRFSVGG